MEVEGFFIEILYLKLKIFVRTKHFWTKQFLYQNFFQTKKFFLTTNFQPKTLKKNCGWWCWLKMILVLSLGLGQVEQHLSPD